MTKSFTLFHRYCVYCIAILWSNGVYSKNPDSKKLNKFGSTVIRAMTFNLWNTGMNVDNGLAKIVRHVLTVDPDIVAVQEVTNSSELTVLIGLLGGQWTGVWRNRARPDTAILTKHALHAVALDPNIEEHGCTKATVTLSIGDKANLSLNVWSLHLDPANYGPYNACGDKRFGREFQILNGEILSDGQRPGRSKNIQAITSDSNFAADLEESDKRTPLLVMGDMNSPSHLDWVETTKNFHCGLTFQWPVSKTLLDKGLHDAYRWLYPDPYANPGNSWSTTQKFMDEKTTIPEPQDRIDFVYFKSNRLKPIRARLYWGNQPVAAWPYHANNDWPSDHASVVVDFLYFSVFSLHP